ncbi:MAG: carbohydrate ABC transporter substrate-binding protein [Clostridiales bacterium]|nr:carbohydrate ABC transporter substrate-binding protein [Clostridiales bacterium]
MSIKKTAKSLSLLLILIMLVGMVLAGCGGGKQPSGEPAGETPDQTSDEPGKEPVEEETEEEPEPEPKKEWEGTITLSFPMGGSLPVWEELAKAYMEKNPKVNVVLDDKESGPAYTDWLGNQLAGGETAADIVLVNTVAQYFAENKFVDFAEYLTMENPYMGKIWMDGLEPASYRSNGPNQEIFCLNIDSVQILWFYNKNIFEEVGVQPPKDWDELIEICAKLKEAGYIPLALAGDTQSFWEMTTGWLFRIYHDQYWRDMEPVVANKEGDYDYDPERDGTWEFDPTDISNDSPEKIHFNGLRVAKMVQDGEVGPDHDKYRAMYTNFAKLIPEYVPEGFFGMSVGQADELFIQGKAAMKVDGAWFAAGFDKTMEDAPEKFELGYFWPPAMKDEHVAVDYARSLGGPNGFIGVVNKSKEQNDLSMDFMMFYASPEGQAIRYAKMEELGLSPAGPSLVYDVQMPEKWESIFGGMGYMGECDNNPFGAFARGFNDEQQSVREWVDLAHQFFKGQLTVEEYSKRMQKVMQDAIPRWLEIRGYRPDALDDPSKDPSA